MWLKQNKTQKEQTHRYREQTSGYQWGEGRVWDNTGVGKKGLLWDYMASCMWNFWKL